MICLLGGPLNSSFILCSRIHTTKPTTKKKQPVTIHKRALNGPRKAQAPEFDFLKGATTTNPDATYGCVKSRIFVLLVTMATSPTTASKNCNKNMSESDTGIYRLNLKLQTTLLCTHTRRNFIHQLCVAWIVFTISKGDKLILNRIW